MIEDERVYKCCQEVKHIQTKLEQLGEETWNIT